MLRRQAVTALHPTHPSRADLDPSQQQLVGDQLSSLRRTCQAVLQDRCLDLLAHSIRVRSLRPRKLVDQPLGRVELEVAPGLVELLPASARCGTPYSRCRAPGPAVADSACDVLSSPSGRWSSFFPVLSE